MRDKREKVEVIKIRRYKVGYEKYIEPEIRDLVKLLRNNGFNTFCSCGHNKYIEMECCQIEDVDRLYYLLLENDILNFRIELKIEAEPLFRKWIELYILDDEQIDNIKFSKMDWKKAYIKKIKNGWKHMR